MVDRSSVAAAARGVQRIESSLLAQFPITALTRGLI